MEIFQEAVRLKQSQLDHKHRVFRSSPEFLQRTLCIRKDDEVHALRAAGVSERLQGAEERRREGNAAVREHDYAGALEAYENALGLFVYFRADGEDRLLCVDEGGGGEARPTVAAIYSNMALCFLRLGQYSDGLYCCDQALERDETLVKALYRRALCNAALENSHGAICLDRAVRDLERAHELDPGDGELGRALQEHRQRQRRRDAEQRGRLGDMFRPQPAAEDTALARRAPPAPSELVRRRRDSPPARPHGHTPAAWQEAEGLVEAVLRQRRSAGECGAPLGGPAGRKELPPPPVLQWLLMFAVVSAVVCIAVHAVAP
eukprot:TRINITY_DN66205_c0_g1_i1.p1 TRINITY_DN66205_c0_g1~~TRINITY_DN66205_c0_g1_i1.p1  ORF type:complete len:343 (+),score=137.93 TRINITY_DN66205_c0_g1_i1:75-1031(+)